MAKYINLSAGDPAPWFSQRSVSNPRYVFDSAGGRYIVLCFFGSAANPHARAAVAAALRERALFDDNRACFFGVSNDPADETEQRLRDVIPGYRFFWDFDGTVARLYGALPTEPGPDGEPSPVRQMWMVLDPTLRIMACIPFRDDRQDIAEVLKLVNGLPSPSRFTGFEIQAPILYLANVFEPDFCQKLIGLYEREGGQDSGFMREENGKTVGVYDYSYKRRRDYMITDKDIMREAQARIRRRVIPEIAKVHQFVATRMERYIVCCYDAEEAAHFGRHRDNTTKGTAHRKFAISVNLNDDFDGGEVSFPEYGPRGYKAPAGAAVVFSCSLLHAVSTVTRGRRYAFLPFLYDDAAAKVREENIKYFADSNANYKA